MDMKAVHAYVEPALRERFEGYRELCGLPSAAALLSLLVMREMKLRRLAAADGPPIPAVQARTGPPRSTKISTIIEARCQTEFAAHAVRLGSSASACAAALASKELDERWLLQALEWSPVP